MQISNLNTHIETQQMQSDKNKPQEAKQQDLHYISCMHACIHMQCVPEAYVGDLIHLTKSTHFHVTVFSLPPDYNEKAD